MFAITEAAVNDVNAMDWIEYEPLACYIFDRGYWDLARLFKIEQLNAFFVIREKGKPKFEVVAGDDLLDGTDGVLRDQTVIFTTRGNKEHYPTTIRRIVFYAEKPQKDFHLLYQQLLFVCQGHCFSVPEQMDGGAVFQIHKATPQSQELLGQ